MRSALLVLFGLALASCDASAPAAPAAVYVGNRGAGEAGGTVTRLDPADLSAPGAEAFGAFGGRVMSVVESGRRLYVLVDLPGPLGRIDVVDLDTGERVRQIAVPSPRRMAIADGRAFVTAADSSVVTSVALATGQPGVSVDVAGPSDGVVAVDGRVYVGQWGGGFGTVVWILDPRSDIVRDRVVVGCEGPRDLVADGEGEVWVFCTGHPSVDGSPVAAGEAVVLDGAAVVARIPLRGEAGTQGRHDAAFSARHDEAFVVVGTALARFDTRTNTLIGYVEIDGAAASPVASVALDDASGRLYLGRFDAADPTGAAGSVSVHDRTGALVGTARAGVAPVSIAFGE